MTLRPTLGSQYWRPPTPPERHWEADLSSMPGLGFRAIKTWHFWSRHNPEEGIFDFSESDRLFAASRKAGVGVVPNLILPSAPEWAFDKYPRARYVSADGFVVPSMSISNVNVGGFPGLCLDNPDAREAAGAFVQAVAERYGEDDNLLAWDVWNEPHVEGARDGNDWPFWERSVYCYCDASVARFREWLDRRFGGLEGLCGRWRRGYTDWSQVRPPCKRGSIVEWYDWRRFWLDNLAEWVSWVARELREAGVGQPVMTHCGGTGSPLSDPGLLGCDDWLLARDMDLYGISVWGCGDYEQALAALDVARSAAAGKRFWVSECYFGTKGVAGDYSRADRAEDAAASALIYAMKGADGILHWQYRSELFGNEAPNFGLLDPTGAPRQALAGLSSAFKLIEDNWEDLERTAPPIPRAAILYSPDSYLLYWAAQRGCDGPKSGFYGGYRCLRKAAGCVDVLRADFAGDLSGYELILASWCPVIPESLAGRLAKYVEAGGTLVVDARFAGYEDDTAYREVIPGFGLDEVLGWRAGDLIVPKGSISASLDGRRFELAQKGFAHAMRPCGGEVVGAFEDGTPAAVLARAGKGRALGFGSHVFATSQNERPLVELLSLLLGGKGEGGSGSASGRVSCKTGQILSLAREGDGLGFVLVVNVGKEEPAVARVALSAGERAVELAGVPMDGGKGCVNVTLPPRAFGFLRIEKGG